jgi:hypothetical protein
MVNTVGGELLFSTARQTISRAAAAGWALEAQQTLNRIYEYTPFCNGPDEVKSPSDRHAAELTLLSVVSAEAATLCC